MLLRKTLYALLTPPNIFFIGLFLCYIFYNKRGFRKLLLIITCCFFILSMPIVADRLHAFLNTHPAASIHQIKHSKAQAIVLLSGGIYGLSAEYTRYMPNENSIIRAVYAAFVARQTQLPILISGGGQRDNSPPGAALIQNFMASELKTPARWIETQSQTTLENARFTKAYLEHFQINHIVLVTESWHMRRAVDVFERQGFEVLAAPTFASRANYEFNVLDKLLPTAHAFRRTQTALHEIIGLLWYQLEMFAHSLE